MSQSQTNLTETNQIEMNENAESIFNGLMLWAAARCGVQYLIVPFLLPFIRLSDSVSVWLNIGISLLAVSVMGWNIKRLWNTHWRKRYLIWCFVAVSIISVFLYLDVKTLIRS
jgi:ABC-type iron transport system FetAB permease component